MHMQIFMRCLPLLRTSTESHEIGCGRSFSTFYLRSWLWYLYLNMILPSECTKYGQLWYDWKSVCMNIYMYRQSPTTCVQYFLKCVKVIHTCFFMAFFLSVCLYLPTFVYLYIRLSLHAFYDEYVSVCIHSKPLMCINAKILLELSPLTLVGEYPFLVLFSYFTVYIIHAEFFIFLHWYIEDSAI